MGHPASGSRDLASYVPTERKPKKIYFVPVEAVCAPA
jgi:hypothetical protein